MAVDFTKIDQEVLDFWDSNGIYAKAKKISSKSKNRFKFIDGPPYANGNVHLGHAINKTMKDMVLRYKRMNDFEVNEQPGFDTHGLPIEMQVEKALGTKNKEEIISKVGKVEFISKCKEFAQKNIKQMTKDFKRFGVWQDWENPYYTHKNEYIEGAWWALKKAFDEGMLYQGKKVITWCPRCATAVAKSELEYKRIKENSVFVKFPLKKEENSYLVIWTTTPWTLPLNMAVMVHPDFDYVQVQTEDGEKLIFAKALAGAIMGLLEKKFKVVKEMTGEKLEGLKYVQPFENDVPKHKEFEHKVILSEQYVSLDAGSGLVHCAPGCGPEDYQIGLKNKIPIFSPLSESGLYEIDAGKYVGMFTKSKETEETILSDLRNKNYLLLQTPVDHEYPHCWRCKHPVIFRATEQWFLGVSKIKAKLLEENKKVSWHPKTAATSFNAWLDNLEDWCISRQRYWGTPLPIWKCECGHVDVVGTIPELKKKSLSSIKDLDLHIPSIDEVKIKCEKCGKEVSRIPDVLDVWLDSGVAPWASLDYPSEKKAYKNNFPLDMVLEAKDQIRGWFNSLMAMSYLVNGMTPYHRVVMNGFIHDEKGRGMSKSLGNGVSPNEVIDKYGSDSMRSYLVSAGGNGDDIKFLWREVEDEFKKFGILWNTFKFIKQNMELEGYEHKSPKDLKKEDQWIISKTHSLIESITKHFEEYELQKVPQEILGFVVDDLSRNYLKLIKDRLYSDDKEDKQNILSVLDFVLLNLCRISAPMYPIVSEKIYQEMKIFFNTPEESVHFLKWPKSDSKKIKQTLQNQMESARDIIGLILNAREKSGVGVRWPLSRVVVVGDDFVIDTIKEFNDLILNQTNLKAIVFSKEDPEFVKESKSLDYERLESVYREDLAVITRRMLEISKEQIERELAKGELIVEDGDKKFILTPVDFKRIESLPENWVKSDSKGIKIYLNTELTGGLLAEGYSRELIRRIQDMRKEMGLNKDQQIKVYIMGSSDVKDMVEEHVESISSRTSSQIIFSDVKTKGQLFKEFKIRNKSIEIAINVEGVKT